MMRRLGFALYIVLGLISGLVPDAVVSCLALAAAIIVWARLQGR